VDRLSLKVQAQVNGEWTKLPKIVRGLWAAPYIIFTWKVVVIDKVFKAGVTDPLSDHDAKVMLMILAFYFVYDLGSSVARFFSKKG
ncbi:MAG: hypothetical protein GXP05_09670, partial [Alphaproteobacteria bacterium]|nr:hypothetical protein [Alphaproteobacteria bacterium]